MDIKILIFLITCLSLVNCGTNHAVIVVGSRGYNNYRHQSNGCKLYNLLIEKGMPAENIIHLNYDDIADSEENPFPGKIFNKPSPKPAVLGSNPRPLSSTVSVICPAWAPS